MPYCCLGTALHTWASCTLVLCVGRLLYRMVHVHIVALQRRPVCCKHMEKVRSSIHHLGSPRGIACLTATAPSCLGVSVDYLCPRASLSLASLL